MREQEKVLGISWGNTNRTTSVGPQPKGVYDRTGAREVAACSGCVPRDEKSPRPHPHQAMTLSPITATTIGGSPSPFIHSVTATRNTEGKGKIADKTPPRQIASDRRLEEPVTALESKAAAAAMQWQLREEKGSLGWAFVHQPSTTPASGSD